MLEEAWTYEGAVRREWPEGSVGTPPVPALAYPRPLAETIGEAPLAAKKV
jgi:hypothetical protein